jgi:hypothetical protein
MNDLFDEDRRFHDSYAALLSFMNRKLKVGLWSVSLLYLVGVVALQSSPAVCAESEVEKMAFLDNGIIKVGASLDRGGSIGFLCDVKKSGSVVNIHDLGRWIGQSYYSGPKPFGTVHPGWKGWPWNPVSAGDVYGYPSKIAVLNNDGKTLYVKSIPMQWALRNVPGDCQFETWITLEGRTVHVRNRLTNDREDRTQYPAMDQELPAVYTIGTLHRLMTYVGDAPFSNGSLTEIPKLSSQDDKPQWTTFFATEHWAALVDDDDWGLGVIHPSVVRFLGGFYGRAHDGGPHDDPTGYLAPVRQEVLDHNIVYEYRYSLVLDTLTNIRKEAYNQRPKSSLPNYHFLTDRQYWWLLNADDAGHPIKGCLRVKVEKDDPQMFGPEGAWEAKKAPVVFIRAAFHTKNNVAEIYWETADKPGFAPNQKVRFIIQPDGKFHTYAVDLSSCPLYRETIRRFRFDPVERGESGEFVDVESMSVEKD